MGGESSEISLDGNPNIILLSGLQGSGKTTFTGKLGRYLTKKGKKTLMVACDVYRPAAIEQLHVIGEDLKIEVFSDSKSKSPLNIAKKAIKHAKENGFKSVIIDTAGRLAIDEKMMDEIKGLKKSLKPHETLFVVDSMIGQTAVDIANSFNEKLGLTGLIITKLDGDSKGGSAVSIVKETGLPIKFIGTGEKVDEFDKFYPDRISSRILGMGDLQTLAEKASEQIDHQKAEDLTKKIVSDSFDFNDLLDQMNSIKKMGSLESIINMIPGVNLNQMGSKLSENESKMNKMKYMIDSMTPIERRNPNILKAV